MITLQKPQRKHLKNRHYYTSEEIIFLLNNIKGKSYIEITRLFNEHFGLELSLSKIQGQIGYLGLKNDRQKDFHIGDERIHKGYVVVKINKSKDGWKSKHAIIWEQAHGPIPKGHVIIFADGNKLNMDLENLLLVSRSEIVYMNHEGLISTNPEFTKTGKLVAKLKLLIGDSRGRHRIREKRTPG